MIYENVCYAQIKLCRLENKCWPLAKKVLLASAGSINKWTNGGLVKRENNLQH